MERRNFLATAAGIGAALAAASTALGAAMPTPVPGSTPLSGSRRNAKRSDANIRRVRRRLERVIDELQHDQHDYGGHRQRALDLLNQARQELLLAEQSDTSH
ncbi:MAG TPA: hypothetical protein VKS80_04785 [Trinickia sp.]|nr:hypothetical protein [Trinickia sp.]